MALVIISREFGASIGAEAAPTNGNSPTPLFRVLLRTRTGLPGCRRNPMPIVFRPADGAMARWRTLDEIAVVSFFVQKHGEDLAERYTVHQHIESWKAAERYNECRERLGYDEFVRVNCSG